jgi:hypothetical protein
MNIADCDVYQGSDLKNYGYTDDSSPFIGELCFVEIESPRGHRWRLNYQFDGVRVERGEDGPIYTDNRPRAKTRCGKLVEAIKRRGMINPMHWHEGRCVYGSQAWEEYGQREDLVLEKMEG